MTRLAREGLLRSLGGPTGGYELAGSAASTSLLDCWTWSPVPPVWRRS